MGQAPASTSLVVHTSSEIEHLAEEANCEHELARGHALAAIEHAAKAGSALRSARDLVGESDWLTWLEDNFYASHHTAYRYMRIARYVDEVRAAGVTTIEDALAFLAGRAQLGHEMGERRSRALELRAAGKSIGQIAGVVGVRESTVEGYLNPKAAAARSERSRQKRNAERKAFERQQRESQIRQAAKGVGGSLSRLYADAERMQDTLGDAVRQISDPEALAALTLAGQHYRRMRDCIVRSLLSEV